MKIIIILTFFSFFNFSESRKIPEKETPRKELAVIWERKIPEQNRRQKRAKI